MVVAFCVRRAGDPPPPPELRGPGNVPVRLVEEGSLGLWVAECAVLSPGVEQAAAHDAVVRAALRTATPVPVRFGTSFPNEEEARASLREREEELSAALERVDGRVEMGLRVTWADEGGGSAADAHAARGAGSGGRAYLLARKRQLEEREERRARAAALLDEVERRVGAEGYPSVRRLLPEPGVAGTLAHLVHRQEARSYRTRVEAARDLPAGVGLYLTGPWAPYSFV